MLSEAAIGFLELMCGHVAYEHDCMTIPINLNVLAKRLGAKVYYSSISAEGFVQRGPDGPEIHIRKDAAFVRKRFSLAHEIGHVLIDRRLKGVGAPDYRKYRKCASLDDLSADEEMANHIAAALLLPGWFMKERLGDRLSMNTIAALASEAQVSVSTALLRVSRIATDKCAVFALRWGPGIPRRILWTRCSRSVDPSLVAEDLSDPVVVDNLLQKKSAVAESLHYRWTECQQYVREHEGVVTCHCLSRVRLPEEDLFF